MSSSAADTPTEPVLVTVSDRIATVTLNRPDIRNANSTPDVVEALVQACDRINRDPDIRAAIFTGAGSAFSSGGEISLMKSFHEREPVDVRSYYVHHGIQRLSRALYSLEVPAIAAVNGPAFGSGCGMALMCDIRIASTRAKFALNFAKLGILPGDGGTLFLLRAIGSQRAAEMMFTGRTIEAGEAAQWGLVHRLVEPEALMDEARRLATEIAANPGHALRFAKRLIREAHLTQFETFLDLTVALQALSHNTEDHRLAVEQLEERLKKR